MLDLDTARARVAARAAALPPIRCPLVDALGCRFAGVPIAVADVPVHSTSSMDGYAAHAGDLAAGTPLRVAFAVAAGDAPPSLPTGVAARIFTGAVVPDGADVVVPQEEATPRGHGSVSLASLPVGSNVRPSGTIVRAGTSVAAVGTPVTPQVMALLAAAGVASVTITPRPRIAIVATGAELVDFHQRPKRGQVRDTNTPMLAALARDSRLEVVRVERAPDERAALGAAIEAAAARAQVVVTSGGVSVGDLDLVPAVTSELDFALVFHKVAIQPGKPILLAHRGNGWLVGLPGNPLSALVGWRMFVRPLAEALAGDPDAFGEEPLLALLTEPASNGGDRTQLRPAVLARSDFGASVRIVPWQGSHDVVAGAGANALARLERGIELGAGAPVECYPLPWHR